MLGGSYGRRVKVLCGKGNNGDDGRVAVEAGDRYIEADAMLIEAMATAILGPSAAAEALANDAEGLGRDIGSERVEALGLLAGARAALRAGDPRGSSRKLRAGSRTCNRHHDWTSWTPIS